MRRFPVVLWFCLLAVLLAACQPRPVQPGPEATRTVQAGTTLTPPSPTPEPSPTPQAPRALLIDSGSGSGPLQTALEELATSSNLQLVTQASLADSDLTAETHIVVVLPPNPGLEKLAGSHAEIQFVAVGIPEAKPSANVSVISSGTGADQIAFLAGYIAALVSEDWRSGVVASSSPEDTAARDAFLHGGGYLCGICNVPFKPYYYPVAVEAGDAQTAVDGLKKNLVKTVYVAPSLANADMYNGLAAADFQIIGTGSPAPELSTHWMATIQSDPSAALRTLWPDLVAGKGNQQVSAPLTVTNPGEALSAGRMRLVNEVILGLADGSIDPASVEMGQ